MIQVDGRNVGRTPASYVLSFEDKSRVVVSAKMEGYHPEEVTLAEDSDPVDDEHLKLVLMEDQAWGVTTTSEATNRWLRVQIDSTLEPDQVWQKLVDSVTSRYANLEQLDMASGYIRTVEELRRFQGPWGQYQVRTRFLGSMAARKPLVYKFKIEAGQTNRFGDWIPYGRVFKEDASLIEELQDRLGIK